MSEVSSMSSGESVFMFFYVERIVVVRHVTKRIRCQTCRDMYDYLVMSEEFAVSHVIKRTLFFAFYVQTIAVVK